MKEKSITLPARARRPHRESLGAVRVGNLLYVAGHPSQSPVKGKSARTSRSNKDSWRRDSRD